MQAATTEIRAITIGEMQAQAEALTVAHWEEVGKERHRRILKPDWDRYFEIEKRGMLLALGLWVDDVLAGYSLTFVGPHLHYRDVVCAQNDLLFVASEHRGGSLGGRLIKATERAAKDRGAHEMVWHAKPDTVLADGLPKLGYGVMDVMFCKELA